MVSLAWNSHPLGECALPHSYITSVMSSITLNSCISPNYTYTVHTNSIPYIAKSSMNNHIFSDTPVSIPEKPHKFIDQFRYFLRSKNYKYATEQTYVHWVLRFIYFHNKRHPKDMGAEEVKQNWDMHTSILHTSKTAKLGHAHFYAHFYPVSSSSCNKISSQ